MLSPHLLNHIALETPCMLALASGARREEEEKRRRDASTTSTEPRGLSTWIRTLPRILLGLQLSMSNINVNIHINKPSVSLTKTKLCDERDDRGCTGRVKLVRIAKCPFFKGGIRFDVNKMLNQSIHGNTKFSQTNPKAAHTTTMTIRNQCSFVKLHFITTNFDISHQTTPHPDNATSSYKKLIKRLKWSLANQWTLRFAALQSLMYWREAATLISTIKGITKTVYVPSESMVFDPDSSHHPRVVSSSTLGSMLFNVKLFLSKWELDGRSRKMSRKMWNQTTKSAIFASCSCKRSSKKIQTKWNEIGMLRNWPRLWDRLR